MSLRRVAAMIDAFLLSNRWTLEYSPKCGSVTTCSSKSRLHLTENVESEDCDGLLRTFSDTNTTQTCWDGG